MAASKKFQKRSFLLALCAVGAGLYAINECWLTKAPRMVDENDPETLQREAQQENQKLSAEQKEIAADKKLLEAYAADGLKAIEELKKDPTQAPEKIEELTNSVTGRNGMMSDKQLQDFFGKYNEAQKTSPQMKRILDDVRKRYALMEAMKKISNPGAGR